MPLSANSPTCSTFTAFSTFVSTRGLLRFARALLHLTAGRQHWKPSRWRHNGSELCRAWRTRAQYRCRSRFRAPADATSQSRSDSVTHFDSVTLSFIFVSHGDGTTEPLAHM